MKPDNEPAIVAVLKETLKAVRADGIVGQVLEKHPPPYDSQSNGLVESAVKTVRGMAGTLHVALESSFACKIPAGHAIMTWLVFHAGNL